MKILLIEPFFTGSHSKWAKGYQMHSRHEVKILSMTGHYWKWRMHGGAVSIAGKYEEMGLKPDLILATDMLDLTTFLALTRAETQGIKTVLYFHENQLTYPWSPTDRDVKKKRDGHYAFINYSSALAADKVFFNSRYHMDSFLGEMPNFLKGFPDNRELKTVEKIADKSEVLYLGMDLKKFDELKIKGAESTPLIIWNHRWEYDKNPEAFFDVLYQLQDEGVDFQAAVLGESYPKRPAIFKEAKKKLSDRIVHFGYAETFEEYAQWLWKGDVLPVTSSQDFFGGSVIEAMYCNCYPLLPNRLAYPEHIPKSEKEKLIYNGNEELVDKLRHLLLNIDETRAYRTSSYVADYDWGVMVEKYDDMMEAFL